MNTKNDGNTHENGLNEIKNIIQYIESLNNKDIEDMN